MIQNGFGDPLGLAGEKPISQLPHVFLLDRRGVLGVTPEDDYLLVRVRGAVSNPANPVLVIPPSQPLGPAERTKLTHLPLSLCL